QSIVADFPALRQALERVRHLPIAPEMRAFYDKVLAEVDRSFASFESAFPAGIQELEKLNARTGQDLKEAQRQLEALEKQLAEPALRLPARAPPRAARAAPPDACGALLRAELLRRPRPPVEEEDDDRIREDPGSVASAWREAGSEPLAPPPPRPTSPTVH